MKYAAFLLGINLGGRTVKMADLKNAIESLGYKDVKTILASGNAVFSGTGTPRAVERKLEAALEKKFKFQIGVIVRTMPEIQKMVQADPFKKVKMTKDIRRYVTFLAAKPASRHSKPLEKGYELLKLTDGEAYTVLDLSKSAKTPDVMLFLRKILGKKITTRNWNTILKVAALK
ncbi:MAG: DUF1697 domain-containing protein [Candidatus Kaiserbacteria bacterium]|nr:DUF1697 domain-containing protein [Candidatus Kaiserbacteria bacterium]